MEVAGNELSFLVLKLTLKDNKIQTIVYSKPTNSHFQSPSVLGIQIGFALRLHRTCSTNEEYSSKSKQYKGYLIGRGHKLKNVEKPFNYF